MDEEKERQEETREKFENKSIKTTSHLCKSVQFHPLLRGVFVYEIIEMCKFLHDKNKV